MTSIAREKVYLAIRETLQEIKEYTINLTSGEKFPIRNSLRRSDIIFLIQERMGRPYSDRVVEKYYLEYMKKQTQ